MRFISLIVLIFLYSCSSDNIVEYKSYLNHHDTIKYVGMNECKACHYCILSFSHLFSWFFISSPIGS